MKPLDIEKKLRMISSTSNDVILTACNGGDRWLVVFVSEDDVQKIHDWTAEWLAERANCAPKTIPVVAGENWEDEPKQYATGAFLFTPPCPAEYINLKIEEDE